MQYAQDKEGNKSYCLYSYPEFKQYLDLHGQIKQKFDKDGKIINVEDEAITINKIVQDRTNFQHLKHHLGLLAMEKRLLKHYNVMDKVIQDGGSKNKRNMERLLEIKELNNITIFFIQLLYHKYNNYSGPTKINNNGECEGADFTFVQDDIVFKNLNPLLGSIETFMKQMLNFKFNVQDSNDVLDYAIKEEQLEEQAEFKKQNKQLGVTKPRKSKK